MKITIHNMGRVARDHMRLPLQVDIDPADLQFEEQCFDNRCKLGKTPSGAACPYCHGKGVILTELGNHVLSFVLRNVREYTEQRYGKEYFKHQIPNCIPRVEAEPAKKTK